MDSSASQAFDLDDEPSPLRDAYGRNLFGQGCLLARRLVERGVPFVEVSLGGVNSGGMGWDTHADNFETVKPVRRARSRLGHAAGRPEGPRPAGIDAGGVDGRIRPHAQDQRHGGRDHYPLAFSAVLGGGRVRGGQVVGATSDDGTTVEDTARAPRRS